MDFIIIPLILWKKWKNIYGGQEIKRFSYKISETLDSETDYYMQKISIITRPYLKWMPPDNSIFYIEKRKAVKDLREKILRIFVLHNKIVEKHAPEILELNLWKINELDVRDLDAQIKSLKSPIEIDGKLMLDDEHIENISLGDDLSILIEFCEKMPLFHFIQEKVIQPRISEKYCPQAAEEIKKIYLDGGLSKSDISFGSLFKSISYKGRIGIDNIGNSCYMNSSLQCLSNCQLLTKYLLLLQNEKNNPVLKNYLVRAYTDILKKMWLDNTNGVNTTNIKNILVKKAQQFRGFAQQDSHELLLVFLDGLHEELNKFKSKSEEKKIPENKQLDNRPEYQKYWKEYLLKNQSIIVDLFAGQLKSNVICPCCNNISVSFDSFMILSLPIPQIFKQEITIIYLDQSRDSFIIEIILKESMTFNEITFKINSLLKNSPNCYFEYFQVNDLKEYQHIPLKSSCSQLFEKNIKLVAYELLPKDYNDYYFLHIDLNYESPSFFGHNIISYPRPIFCPIHKSAAIFDVKIAIFEKLKGFIKLDIPRVEIKKQYAMYFMNSGGNVPPYILEIVNNRVNKGYNFWSDYQPCEFCNGGKHSKNCLFNFGDEELFGEIIERIKGKREFKLAAKIKNPSFNEKGINTVQLKLPENSSDKRINLNDCLRLFSQEEKLDSQNEWYCNHCKKSVEAAKTLNLIRLPLILIIHLKRFQNKILSDSILSRKIFDLVDYPMIGLDLSEFLPKKILAAFLIFLQYPAILGI